MAPRRNNGAPHAGATPDRREQPQGSSGTPRTSRSSSRRSPRFRRRATPARVVYEVGRFPSLAARRSRGAHTRRFGQPGASRPLRRQRRWLRHLPREPCGTFVAEIRSIMPMGPRPGLGRRRRRRRAAAEGGAQRNVNRGAPPQGSRPRPPVRPPCSLRSLPVHTG
jgi:hypothetical protein